MYAVEGARRGEVAAAHRAVAARALLLGCALQLPRRLGPPHLLRGHGGGRPLDRTVHDQPLLQPALGLGVGLVLGLGLGLGVGLGVGVGVGLGLGLGLG